MTTTKKLLVSVAALVMTIALATTATFAWFTMNNKLTLGGLDVNVTTGTDGIYFSLTENGPYTANIEATAIAAALKAATTDLGANALNYAATTTTDGIVFKDAAGTTMNPNKYDTANKSASYASFKIYFRANKAFDVYLDGTEDTSVARSSILPQTTFASTSAIKAWKNLFDGADAANKGNGLYSAETTHMQAQGENIVARAANAARVSFVPKDAAKGLVWNPNSEKGYNKVASTIKAPATTATLGNLAYDYQGNIWGNGIAFPTALLEGSSEDLLYKPSADIVSMQTGDPATTVNGTSLIKLTEAMEADNTTSKGYYEGEMTINIWLEGWDGECLNHIFNDAFTTKMSFVGKAA